ncbi:carbonic anhydrase [Methylobacter sp. S3L5C]|uniref:carbonic anhydrase n=1 Tax=Methylobacter sp. S3L5C TaxID=2839024 RepID=UPI001FAE3F13|nr:carbonic anhydrase [Methylobacter sp. S3L5C]UOA09473.1 carbonic anhydrase [Methylobacter sp. S3L5C]
MTNPFITRRQWLFGACCAGLGIASGVVAETVNVGAIDTESYPSNANEALMRLKNGNQRFMDDISQHSHEKASWRSLLVETQKPFATIVGCSDSRVPPELIFDEGFGELFTIRLAGNIIAEDVVGSLQYAVAHLHTRLIVVLGHEGCGAVTATVEEMLNKTKELEHIESLIKSIKPGLKKLNLKLDRQALLHAAVEANVRWSMRELLALPEAKRALREKQVILAGAIYELNTGHVRFLD